MWVVAVWNGDTVSAVQTCLYPAGTNIELKLALETDVTLRADAVFEIFRKTLLGATVTKAVLVKNANILDSLATNAVVFAREFACWWILPDIFKLTNGSHIPILAVAPEMAVL